MIILIVYIFSMILFTKNSYIFSMIFFTSTIIFTTNINSFTKNISSSTTNISSFTQNINSSYTDIYVGLKINAIDALRRYHVAELKRGPRRSRKLEDFDLLLILGSSRARAAARARFLDEKL